MPPPSSHPRTNAIESTNQSPLGSEDGATRTKRVKLNFVDKGSASDGSNIATECDSKCYGSQKTCVDGEYEGDLNSSGEREGWGVIKYLGDTSNKILTKDALPIRISHFPFSVHHVSFPLSFVDIPVCRKIIKV